MADYLCNHYDGAGMLWQYWLKLDVIRQYKIRFDEKANWFEDADFLLRFMLNAETVLVVPKIFYHYNIRQDSAMRSSCKEDRLRCSIALNISLYRYLKSNSFPTDKRKGAMKWIAISTAWCLRDASPTCVKEFYRKVKASGMLPLPLSGSLKQKIQIAILNTSFNLYRLFFE